MITRVYTPASSSEPREEWLLDDAIDDTFPASDPVSHGQPGSLVNLRYAALQGNRRSIARDRAMPWLLVGAAFACTAAFVLWRRTQRGDLR